MPALFARFIPIAVLAAAALAPGCGEDAPGGAAASVSAPAAAERTSPSGPLVAFLGDSLTAGLHLDDPDREAFPAVLGRRLAARGLDVRVLNSGVSGDTTAGGLSRVDWLLRQKPDLVVVALGANDGLRGVPPATVRTQLAAILDRIVARGAAVLLLGMRLPPNLDASYVTPFEAIYADLARERDLALVPFFLDGVGGVPELNFPDGMHPTAAGHERIADNVEAALAAAIAGLE